MQFKGERTTKIFPFHYFILGEGLRVFSVVVLKALGYLLDSLKKFSGLRESCEEAQQLHHIPKPQDCKQVQERQCALPCN